MKIGTFLKTFSDIRWRHRFKNRRELEEYQKIELEHYRRFLMKESPYFKEGIPSDFRMNKAFMMSHFNELNTQGVDRDECLSIAMNSEKTRDFTQLQGQIAVGLSSGTSGHRGLFITTEEERSMWAAAVLAKMLPKGRCFGHRIAFFLRADNELYQTVNSPLIRLEYFDTFKSVTEHIERLNCYQPTILVAPASMLLDLAKELQQGNLKIHPIKIVSVAEILEARDAEFIREVFGIDILDQVYQATEGFLACTCPCGHLHLNEDIVHVEKHYIGEKRFYPVITDFKRRSQPIFRYELNDILVENTEPCPCGSIFTRIEKIEGRSDDIFVFKNEDGKVVEVFPDFIRRCLLLVDKVGEYQVAQINETLLKIFLNNRNATIEDAILQQFQLLAEQKNFLMPRILFEDYQPDKTRKLKRVYREQPV
ncbi:MAG: CoF synthetase [Streptococcus sp.]|nr:CoF synthetase [Streptococcus sp.]